MQIQAFFATFFVSMLPLIELKGAIPFGMSAQVFSEPLSVGFALLAAMFGSSLVVPMLAILFKPVAKWLEKFKIFRTFLSFLTSDIREKSEKFSDEKPIEKPIEKSEKNQKTQKITLKNSKKRKKNAIFGKMLSVFLFVAFPVPLTGVWTGTVFGVLLGLKFWQICLSAILGNIICGVIVAFVCGSFPNAANIFLVVFLAILIFALVLKIIGHKNPNKIS